MSISVFIDNNIWDFLVKHQLDLSLQLPKPDFSLAITRESEFEMRVLQANKPELWAFIKHSQRDASVVTDTLFGFSDPELSSEDQRVGGWDMGRFGNEEEAKLLAALHQRRAARERKLNPKTGLHKDEADLSLASRSCHSVVLTCDRKPGPLKDAHELGGMVLFLNDFSPLTHKLSDLVREVYEKAGTRA